MVSRRRFLAATPAALAGAAVLPGCAAQAAITPAASASAARPGARPKNVILLIPDGLGTAMATAARLVAGRPLALDAVATGYSSTRASDTAVTDSAAAGTALAAGVRTTNGAVGVDDDRRPVASLLEAARTRGMRTGLVTTTRMTHATPAVFAAHVPSRAMENEIAVQMLETAPDVMIGGGVEFFLPAPEGRRTDGRDLLAEARAAGYAVARTGADLADTRSSRVLALLSVNHLAYDVDRPAAGQPSLAELTDDALGRLAGAPEGFFLMVEGGRIDHAAHGNDAVATLSDTLAFDAAVASALAFAARDGETLVVSVADHETGGLSIGRDGVYAFRPEVLTRTTASAEAMTARARQGGAQPSAADLERLLADVSPGLDLTDADRAALALAAQATGQYEPGQSLAAIVSRHALAGWTTGGHTGEDVTLHAAGPGREAFVGYHENIAIPRAIAGLLGLDLDAETARLVAARPQLVPTGG